MTETDAPEVFSSLSTFGLSSQKEHVKKWYDGFIFGDVTDIYNPWSILNYLDKKEFAPYWANSSSNRLVGKLLQEGNRDVKKYFERLLAGEHLLMPIDEQIVYNELDSNESAIWSLLLASGYLKVIRYGNHKNENYSLMEPYYELALTNLEVKKMFYSTVHKWFRRIHSVYNDFIKALLMGDLKAMNLYMNKVAIATFSYFDTGNRPSGCEPERFYHGFVLGLLVELSDRYALTSNRESGFGRYDVMLEPKNSRDSAILMEFKVQEDDEKKLSDTVASALKQIETKNYEASLIEKGFSKEHIRKYGFAFCGKKVLIGEGKKRKI